MISMPLLIVMVLWGSHLAFPMQSLQHIRWIVLGHVVPVYYFFTVVPILAAAIVVLRFKRNWTNWELAWALLPVICLPGIIFSDDRAWSVRQWLSWAIRGVIPGAILFYSGGQFAGTILKRGIYPIVIAAAMLGLFELYYDHNPLWERTSLYSTLDIAEPQHNPFYRPQESYLLNSYAPGPWRVRPAGTQGNRIAYASTLVGFFPLGLWLLRYRKRLPFLHLTAVASQIAILILAQARSAWVGLSTILLLMGLHGRRRDFFRMIAGILLCLSSFLLWPRTQGALWSRITSFHADDASISERLKILQTARVLKEHWLTGVGYGQFPTACRSYYPQEQTWIGTPDNQLLRWTIENGVASILFLVIFFVGITRAGWQKIQTMDNPFQADFYRALLYGWLGVAVTFLFFDGFYWGACNFTFWCLFGLFATCLSPNRLLLPTTVVAKHGP